MKPLPLPAWMILVAGLGVGVLGDMMLRAPGAPGLNFTVVITAGVLAVLILSQRTGAESHTETRLLLAAVVLFAATLAWRDAPALKLVALGSATASFSLAAYHAGAAWIQRTGAGAYAAALVSNGIAAALGPAAALASTDWTRLRGESMARPVARRSFAVARGFVVAVPLVIVFGSLLMSADAVFATMITDALRVDLETMVSHVFLTGFLAWIATGAISGFLAGTRLRMTPSIENRGNVVGITEVAVVLGILAALFAAFVVVQFRYLFDGNALVEVTPGLTYADYARRGFFELVTVVVLILPVLYAADWLLRRQGPGDELTFRIVAGLQIVLVFAIAASAIERMRLYVDAYGLTVLRFNVTAILVLACIVLILFAITVLRGKRQSFAFATLVATLATAATLIAMNPDGRIARYNLARAADPQTQITFDSNYAATLSADAVPDLVDGMAVLPASAQCVIARTMLSRWSPERPASWRTWNWSAARAREEVKRNEPMLRRAAGETAAPCAV